MSVDIFVDISKIISYELSFYYKINGVSDCKLFQAFDELLFCYCSFFLATFRKIFQIPFKSRKLQSGIRKLISVL